MRPQKVDDTELIETLLSVFVSKGYNGASMNELAAASGLKKASLYHRFPGGKKDMGLAVFNFASQWKATNINAILNNPSLSTEEKLSTILKNITLLYQSGSCSCLMKAMSMGEGLFLFEDELKEGMTGWLESFIELGLLFNCPLKVAKEKATQSLVKIQGSLIVSQNLKNTEPFVLAIKEIEELYKSINTNN